MNNPNDSSDDEDQKVIQITDYRALLDMTRALVIQHDPGLSSLVSPEAENSRRESVLKTGEIIYPNPSAQEITDGKAPASPSDSPQKDDDWNFRIYLGMS